METIRETKYLYFVAEDIPGRLTKIIHVVNRSSESTIATIEWYGSWRQYCFMPNPNTVWNPDCLKSVNEVISVLMEQRRIKLSNP